MAVLEVNNLTKKYGQAETEVVALDNVSFKVEKGEFVAIVGASGSGKSTLTAEENIALPWRLDGRKADQKRLDDITKMLGLEARANHLPGQMSGGQQQRVSIGRALINEPAFILADEPTGNLDSKTSSEIMDILKLTNQKYNQTILLVTHDEKIALMAKRVITIGDGRIVRDEVMR